MKMLKKSVFLLLAAATVVSCSKTELGAPETEGTDIVLKSSFTKIDATTRAPFVSELSEENPLTARVLGSLNQSSYSSLFANGTMTFKGSPDGVAYNRPLTSGTNFFSGAAPVYLVGLYPIDFTVASGAATLTLTGKEDVMYAPEVSTTKAEVQNLEFATLAFEHQLTKLDMRFRADGPDAIAAYGTIKKVEMIAANGSPIQTGVSIALGTGAITLANPVTTEYGCYSMSVDANDVVSYSDDVYAGDHLLTTDIVYLAYTLAPPVTAATGSGANEYSFRITYNIGGGDLTKDVTVDLKDVEGNLFEGSTKGYSFLISFHFSKSEINATATVQDWYEGGETIVIID